MSKFTTFFAIFFAMTLVGLGQDLDEKIDLVLEKLDNISSKLDPVEKEVVELRAQLRRDGKMASEVWLYRWTV